jgi:ParB family chromosome partitioning protein
MNAKKQALGRGLGALLNNDYDIQGKSISSIQTPVVGGISNIPISQISANIDQPRKEFDKEKLNQLADSIKQQGIIQPITIRKISRNKYELISGERRFRASKMIGLKEIPAYIKEANDTQALEMALVENIQRQDLDAIEVALSYQRLIEECNLTQDQMSDRVGKKRSTITNYLRLLKLDPIVQTGIRDGILSMGHGRALINIDDEEVQLEFYELILKEGLSVRQVEELVKNYKEGIMPSKEKKEKAIKPEYIVSTQKSLSDHFGNKVDIKIAKNGKGKLVINFHSEADLDRIKNLIQ